MEIPIDVATVVRLTGQGLSTRQAEVLVFVHEYNKQYGYQPTIREIGKRFAISSPNGTMCHLRALQRKGWITCGSGRSRALGNLRPIDDPTPAPESPAAAAMKDVAELVAAAQAVVAWLDGIVAPKSQTTALRDRLRAAAAKVEAGS
jgi:SOS-response transcriptional repressor LexA